jgi:hypothetical protein
MEITNYFNEVFSIFSRLPVVHKDTLQLAGREIQLKTPSTDLHRLFIPSLSHLIVPESTNEPQLTILFAEDKDLPNKLTAPPFIERYNAQGYLADLEDNDVQIFFQSWQKQIFMYSRTRKVGIYWASSAQEVPWWETTFSFRNLFHLWTHNLPAQLVHAGAIANEDAGVLITGPSGSGKSTSCLNLLRAGFKYLGDDYVWVELEPYPVVHALYQTAKVEADNLRERFSDWMPFVINPEVYQEQKAIFDIKALFPEGWRPSVKLKAILLPNIAHQLNTSFQQTASTKAFLGMAPTTLHHLPHHRQISYQKFTQLSAALPTYNWNLGSDRDQFQNSFKNFLSYGLS